MDAIPRAWFDRAIGDKGAELSIFGELRAVGSARIGAVEKR
jgi:hypothetical protein